jgi:hypothetical protein
MKVMDITNPLSSTFGRIWQPFVHAKFGTPATPNPLLITLARGCQVASLPKELAPLECAATGIDVPSVALDHVEPVHTLSVSSALPSIPYPHKESTFVGWPTVPSVRSPLKV